MDSCAVLSASTPSILETLLNNSNLRDRPAVPFFLIYKVTTSDITRHNPMGIARAHANAAINIATCSACVQIQCWPLIMFTTPDQPGLLQVYGVIRHCSAMADQLQAQHVAVSCQLSCTCNSVATLSQAHISETAQLSTRSS